MTIHWGILSTAHINRRVIPAIQQSNRGLLMGVASRDILRAEAYASSWNIPKAYGSYEALLADPDIHVIYISLPNHLHAEWIIKSLEAGKQVLCEKPMCLSLSEMDSVEATCSRTGNFVMEGFMHLHHPQTHPASSTHQAQGTGSRPGGLSAACWAALVLSLIHI